MPLHISSDQHCYDPAVERWIRNCIDSIERLHGKLVGCQVVIRTGSAPGCDDAKSIGIKVHLTLPGVTLCVNTVQPTKAPRCDVHAVLQDAFAILRQRLLEHDHEQVAALGQWSYP